MCRRHYTQKKRYKNIEKFVFANYWTPKTLRYIIKYRFLSQTNTFSRTTCVRKRNKQTKTIVCPSNICFFIKLIGHKFYSACIWINAQLRTRCKTKCYFALITAIRSCFFCTQNINMVVIIFIIIVPQFLSVNYTVYELST